MSKKGENIYKRKDGRWEGRYIKDRDSFGKIKYGYVYAKTYHEVKEKINICNIQILENNDLKNNLNNILFSTVALEWYSLIKVKTKISTQNKYYNILQNYLIPIFGNQRFNTITYEFIEYQSSYLLSQGGKKKNGLSSKTVEDILSVLRSIIKHAKRKGINVPCDGRNINTGNISKPIHIFSRDEQITLSLYLVKNINSYNLGILIGLFTGLRIGEICALRWEDVSFADQTIYVHHTLQRIQDMNNNTSKTRVIISTPKSKCSIRIIPIPDNFCNILKKYKKSYSGYLLTNSEEVYIEPRSLQNNFKKALKICGINIVNFHTVRHTFATRCIELGFDIKSLSEILGHSTVNITMNRYVHPTLELKKNNMKKLSMLLAVNNIVIKK